MSTELHKTLIKQGPSMVMKAMMASRNDDAKALASAVTALRQWVEGGESGPRPDDAIQLLSDEYLRQELAGPEKPQPTSASEPAQPTAVVEAPSAKEPARTPPPPTVESRQKVAPVDTPPARESATVPSSPLAASRPETAPPVREPPPVPPIVTPREDSPEKIAQRQMLNRARGFLASRDYQGALGALDAGAVLGFVPEFEAEAQQLRKELTGAIAQNIKNLEATAANTKKTQPRNTQAQRAAWQKVLEADPDNTAATAALAALAVTERAAALQRDLQDIDALLSASQVKISDVEAARNRADTLRRDGATPAELKPKFDTAHNRLSDLRNRMLNASEGGASSERAQAYEAAIAKYRAAMDAGFVEIADDTGERGATVDVAKALGRTRKAYFADLKNRVDQRLKDADGFTRDGFPETALSRLNEAKTLIDKIEEGGEESRARVNDQLSAAEEDNANKQKAYKLIARADNTLDPTAARALLLEAQQLYPKTPNLEKRIADNDQAVVNAVCQQMSTDLKAAGGLLAMARLGERGEATKRQFAEARKQCETALGRGATVISRSEERDRKRAEANALLDEIGKIEAASETVLDALVKVDGALTATAASAPNVRLAKTLLDDLESNSQLRVLTGSDRPASDARISHRRAQLDSLGDAQQKLRGAEQQFEQGRYAEVEKLLADVAGEYAGRAKELRARARARQYLDAARTSYLDGRKFDQAKTQLNAVRGLRDDLPKADAELVQQAERMLAQLEYAHPRYMRCFEEQRRAKPDWTKWLQDIQALRAAPPANAGPHLREGLDAWLRDVIELEFTKGGSGWLEEALREAETLRGDAVRQYQLLEPLQAAGLLEPQQPQWRRVQYDYYVAKRGKPAERDGREALLAAEGFAQKALEIAPSERYAEAREACAGVVRVVTLAQATIIATDAKRGPQGAAQYIRERITEHSALGLGTDAVLLGRLLRFQLDSEDFDGAEQQAKSIGYLEGESALGPQWVLLTRVGRWMAAGQLHDAVTVINEVRGRLKPAAASPANELEAHLRQRLEAKLRDQAGYASATLSDQALLARVQALSQLKALGNEGADAEMKAVSADLEKLVRPLQERANAVRLGDSLEESLNKADALVNEITAVIAAMKIGGLTTKLDQLENKRKNIAEMASDWHDAHNRLESLKAEWTSNVAGTWIQDNSISRLRDMLEPLQLKASSTQEVIAWETKVEGLQSVVENTDRGRLGLRAMLKALRIAWDEEDFRKFKDVLGQCDLAQRDARTRLNEQQFAIPDSHLRFKDFYGRFPEDVAGIEKLRKRATEKQENLKKWQVWSEAFAERLQEAMDAESRTAAALALRPPCLSDSIATLTDVQDAIRSLKQQLKQQPDQALSKQAQDMADEYPADGYEEQLEEKLRWSEETQASTSKALAAVEPLVAALKRFVERSNLQSGRTVAEIKKRIDQIRALDACHPEANRYEELVRRYS